MKYILVTGGGVDKEIITRSIGFLLNACNLRVNAIKIDTYICLNPKCASPTRKVYITKDGCKVDQDLRNYERFLDIRLSGKNHITTGKIYQKVINQEREGRYLGKTVQTVNHITDCIQDWIKEVATLKNEFVDLSETDICLIELGGAVDHTSAMAFTEALRQFASDQRREDFCCVHVVFVPRTKTSGEFKTKALQFNVQELRKLIICPNMIVCRSEYAIPDSVRDKIARSCGVGTEQVINLPDSPLCNPVPDELELQGMIKTLAEWLRLDLKTDPKKIALWSDIENDNLQEINK